MNDATRQHLDAMTVRQARIHASPPDLRWYVVTANNWVVRGPFHERSGAELELTILRRKAMDEAEDAEIFDDRDAAYDPRPDPRTHPEYWTE